MGSLFKQRYTRFTTTLLVGMLAGIILLVFSACIASPIKIGQSPTNELSKIDSFIVDATPIASLYHDLADKAWNASLSKHYVTMLNTGDDALLTRLHLIRTARSSIDLQVFIWVDDDIGGLLFDELLKAAQRGVRVRLLFDQFGVDADSKALAHMAAAHTNLSLRFYKPVLGRVQKSPIFYAGTAPFTFQKVNRRMHNKLLVVDGRMGILGGRNIENKYFDRDTRFDFKDRDILVIGPEVTSMRASFNLYWEHEVVKRAVELTDLSTAIAKLPKDASLKPIRTADSRKAFADILLEADKYSLVAMRPHLKLYPVERIRFIADWPNRKVQKNTAGGVDCTKEIIKLMRQARTSLVAQTPYLVLEGGGRDLKKLRKRNPDMEMLFSSNSLASTDAFYVYAVSLQQRRRFIKGLGCEIFEFKPFPEDILKLVPRYEKLMQQTSRASQGNDEEAVPLERTARQSGPRLCIHAKSFIVDHKIAFIGSHNFDPRSKRLNTECGIIIWDSTVAEALRENIQLDIAPQNSWVVAKRPRTPVIGHVSEYAGALSSHVPILDAWPIKYTSCFELREGMTPVSIKHPDFRKNYKNVGCFPGVGLSTSQIFTRLIAAFAKPVRSLM
jgi:cardiolipin synthase C